LTHKFLLKQLGILFYSSSLVACAGTAEPSGGGSYADEPAGSDCISQASVRDYKILDDANLIVTAGGSRKYHVLLSRRAMNLRSSAAIGFDSNSGRICSNFSDLIVHSSFAHESIRITSVRRLTPEDEHDLLVRFGRKEPDYEEPRQTKQVDGAEVEELD
jgi:hypothetical protein